MKIIRAEELKRLQLEIVFLQRDKQRLKKQLKESRQESRKLKIRLHDFERRLNESENLREIAESVVEQHLARK